MYIQPSILSPKSRFINMLASYGIKNPVLSVFSRVQREFFLPKEYKYSAYEDRALPIGQGQTNSQPSLTAITLQALHLTGQEKVLEVGTGLGYQTAILSFLAKKIISLEINEYLARESIKKIKKLKIENVQIIHADGSLGYEKEEPYDIIIVNAAFRNVPQPLIKQLKIEGKLVMPVGEAQSQELNLYKKEGNELLRIRRVSNVSFVPLIGKFGKRGKA